MRREAYPDAAMLLYPRHMSKSISDSEIDIIILLKLPEECVRLAPAKDIPADCPPQFVGEVVADLRVNVVILVVRANPRKQRKAHGLIAYTSSRSKGY